ncbi:hypothetical protein AB6A40_000617 [Gnathostoma spinigerum]|uniref:WH1 domain-containing protein n=1 Tax=Gnathostoma spinigerum TaxID=75299 RepID=A0ABD6E2I7_9BILA
MPKVNVINGIMQSTRKSVSIKRINVGSPALPNHINSAIFALLGPSSYALATGVVDFLVAGRFAHEWSEIAIGAVVCYVRDYNAREVTLRLFCRRVGQYSECRLWRLHICVDDVFKRWAQIFVYFVERSSLLVALRFYSENDADQFVRKVNMHQEGRRQSVIDTPVKRLWRIEKSEYSITEHPDSEKPEYSMTEHSDSENSEYSKIEHPDSENSEYLKEVISEKTEQQLKTSLSQLKFFLMKWGRNDTKENEKNLKKKKKTKAPKANDEQNITISLPFGFKHISGKSKELVNRTTEMESIIRELYELNGEDVDKADRAEVAMVQQQVNKVGVDRMKMSLRFTRKKLKNAAQHGFTRNDHHLQPVPQTDNVESRNHELPLVDAPVISRHGSSLKRQDYVSGRPKTPIIRRATTRPPLLPKPVITSKNSTQKYRCITDLDPGWTHKTEIFASLHTLQTSPLRASHINSSDSADDLSASCAPKLGCSIKTSPLFNNNNLHEIAEETIYDVPACGDQPSCSSSRLSLPTDTENSVGNRLSDTTFDADDEGLENSEPSENLVAVIGRMILDRRKRLALSDDEDDENSSDGDEEWSDDEASE